MTWRAEDPTSAAAAFAAMRDAIGMPYRGRRVMLFGTSIEAYNTFSATPNTDGYLAGAKQIDHGQVGYLTAFNQLSGRKLHLDPALNKGVGGDTTALMLARYATDVVANFSAFDVLVIGGPTNDAPAGIAKETTLARLQYFAQTAMDAGKAVIMFTIFPRTGWGAANGVQKTLYGKQAQWVNRALIAWARGLGNRAPLRIVDCWRDFSDPANAVTTVGGGGYAINGAAFADGLHLSGYGAYLAGKRMNDTVGPLFDAPSPFGMGAADVFDATDNPYGNALANPNLHTTTGGTNTNTTAASGVPASWTAVHGLLGGGAVTASECVYSTGAADAKGYDAVLGRTANFALTLASGKSAVSYARMLSANVTGGTFWTPGAVVQASAKIRATNLTGFAGASVGLAYSPDNGATNYSRADGTPNISTGISWGQDDQILYLESPPLVVPNDAQTTVYGFMSVFAYFDARTAPAAGDIVMSDIRLNRLG